MKIKDNTVTNINIIFVYKVSKRIKMNKSDKNDFIAKIEPIKIIFNKFF